MEGLPSKHVLGTALEAGKSQVKVSADLVSGEDLAPGSWMVVFSLFPLVEEGMKRNEKERKSLYCKGTNPIPMT